MLTTTVARLGKIAVGVAVAGLLAGSASAELSWALVSPYLKVQVALAHDTTDGVSEAATAIATAAKELGDDGQNLAVAAATLAEAQTIAAARDAFGSLSEALIEYGTDTGFGDLRVAYCPMVDKSWVQEDGWIANPFYGAMMLTCGEFK